METHEKALIRYAYGVLRDADLACDIIQETFMKYLKYRENNEAPENCRAWLYKVSYNLSIDHLRRHKTRYTAENVLRDSFDEMHQSTPDRILEKRDAEQTAWEGLKNLSAKEQQVVFLKVHEEKSYQEISEEMGISVSHVGILLHRTMKKLSEQMSEKMA